MRHVFLLLVLLLLWTIPSYAQLASSTSTIPSQFSPNGTLNPRTGPFNAAGDGKWCLNDGSISSSVNTTTLTCSTSAPFAATDVGKTIVVYGAGAAGADLITTITGFTSSSVVTVGAAAGTTVTTAVVAFATLDDTAFASWWATANLRAPIDATNFPNTAASLQQSYVIPQGTYILSAALPAAFNSHIHITCNNAFIVFTGAGPLFTWGDGGTHFTIDHSIDGCTFYGTTAMNTELINLNFSDKDKFSRNNFYNFVNGAIWKGGGNGDGMLTLSDNHLVNIKQGIDCTHRCDDMLLLHNIVGNYNDRAFILDDNNAETDANFAAIGNKCNDNSTTSVACFDIGPMHGGVILGNYFESNNSAAATDTFARLGFLGASGFDTDSIKIEGNIANGHARDTAFVETVTNGVSNPNVKNISVKHNYVDSFTNVMNISLGNLSYSDIGPNFETNISGTAYVNAGLSNGNENYQFAATTADTQLSVPLINFNGIRCAGKSQQTGDYTLTNHDCFVAMAPGATNHTATLPASNGNGQIYIIEKEDSAAGVVTIATTSSNTIDGASTMTLANQFDYVVLVSRSVTNSIAWQVIAGNVHPGGTNVLKLASAPANAVGAGNCKLFAVAGTNAGTCKLCAVCGTSTTAVCPAQFDNIGAGC